GRGVGRDRILPRLVGSMSTHTAAPRTAFNHLFYWFLFAQGGIIAAILIPVHVLIQGILGPLGIVPVVDRHYDTWVSALGNPIVKLYPVVVITAAFVHLAEPVSCLLASRVFQ